MAGIRLALAACPGPVRFGPWHMAGFKRLAAGSPHMAAGRRQSAHVPSGVAAAGKAQGREQVLVELDPDEMNRIAIRGVDPGAFARLRTGHRGRETVGISAETP